MARIGMASLILELRNLAQAGNADYVLNSVTYWTDDQLQSALDVWQWQNYKIPLDYITYSSTDYRLPTRIERAGLNSGFSVMNADGNVVSAVLYSINYDSSVLTFTTAQNGVAYTANYRSYNLNNAVADVWGIKAGYFADLVSWASDNHRVDLGKQYENALAMQRKFANLTNAIVFSRRFRTDEVNYED